VPVVVPKRICLLWAPTLVVDERAPVGARSFHHLPRGVKRLYT